MTLRGHSLTARLTRLLPRGVGRMAGDSALLWVAQMGGVAISVLVTIFVTRALGPDGRGIYSWLLTLAGIGAHVALFGMDNANRRLAAAEPEKLPALLRMNLLIIGGAGSVMACVLGLAALPLPGSGHNLLWMALAVASLPLNALGIALGSVLIAQGQIRRAAWQLLLPKVVMAVTYGLLLLTAWVNVGSVLAFNLLVVACGVAVPLWWLRDALRHGRTLPLRPYVAGVWKMCSATYVSGLSYYVMQKVDVLLVGMYLGHAATGFYGVASNMVDLMLTPVSLVAFLLGARLAKGGKGGEKRFSGTVVALVMALAVAGSALTYVLAPWLIPLLFGAAFAPSVVVLQMLCPAVVGLCLFMLMNNVLLATARARHLAVPAVLGALCNVALNTQLIPDYGLMGACWASIASYWIAALCAAGMVGHRMIRHPKV